MIIPVGVTTKKKIIAIIIGEIIFPNSIPNLNHSLFNGDKNLESNIPNIKKINEIAIDHNLKSPSFSKGYIPIKRKTIKNTNPKLRLELLLI